MMSANYFFLIPVKHQDLETLNERRFTILKGIIESYIETSEPVGSRMLSKNPSINLSPATIRNIMSDLADMGFLCQSHTSAGRIPTDKAFRFYVDTVVDISSLPDMIREQIDQLSQPDVLQFENLLYNVTRTIADLTQFMCIITKPLAELSLLKRIEFLKVAESSILVVLVTKSGVVHNKILQLSQDLSQTFLNKISEFLNEQFKNYSLLKARNQLFDSMLEDKVRYDKLLAQAIRLGKKAFDFDDMPEFYIDGHINMIVSSNSQRQISIKSILQTLEQKQTVMNLIDSTIHADGVQIFIGIENTCNELQDSTMISSGYGFKGNPLGIVGVIGPTAMDYQNVIPIVDYTSQILSNSLIENTDSPK